MDYTPQSSVSLAKLSSSPVLLALPLIRLPLALNNFVTIILAAIQIDAIYVAEIVFLGLSLLLAFGVVGHFYRSKKRQPTKVGDAEALNIHSSFLLVAADFVLALSFFILHIIGTIAYYGSVLRTYVAIGALVAWIIHLTLAVAEGYLWVKHSYRRREPRPRCPTCNSKLGRREAPEHMVEETAENRLEPRGRDAKIDFEGLVNETGESEDDRLILMPGDGED